MLKFGNAKLGCGILMVIDGELTCASVPEETFFYFEAEVVGSAFGSICLEVVYVLTKT